MTDLQINRAIANASGIFTHGYPNGSEDKPMNEELVMRLNQIEESLKSTTKPGPWKAAKAGTRVYVPELSKPGEPYYSKAEDDCILAANEESVLGSTEWLLVRFEDLSFMANAKADVEFLLNELRKRLEKPTEAVKIKLFQQDDCAPDSMEYFEEQLVKEIGINSYKFKLDAKFKEADMTLSWELNGYLLEYSGDDPFYILYKLGEVK
jgi:hypothetical protein